MNADPAFERQVDALLRDPLTERLQQALDALPPGATTAAAKALRAEILRRRGEFRAAALLFDEAIASAPAVPAAWHAGALAHVACGERARARAIWTDLLDRNADDPLARYQIALSWHDDGEPAEAARWYQRQLDRFPKTAAAALNLGVACIELTRFDDAVRALDAATMLDPASLRGWSVLGHALHRRGRFTEAANAWLRAAALDPKDAVHLTRAAEALSDAAELPAAIAVLQRALALEPESASLRSMIAADLVNLGLHREALRYRREAIGLDPADWRAHSIMLLESQYDATLATRDELASAAGRWARTHASGMPRLARVPRPAPTTPGRRLRIGYLSPRVADGPLASFFVPVLEAQDRERIDISLYAADADSAVLPERVRSACDRWRALPGDDDAAAALIAADGLDLIVDLAGHAPGNRLPVLARRPAPVQVSWLDWFDTTGMAEIDYLVSDRVHTPAADARFFRERIVWLPHCRFAYAPVISPTPSVAPRSRRGHVTFGSFNRHAKITADVLATWRAVLAAVPDSRLQLRASAYRGAGTVAWLRERWARAGLPVDRIDFLPYLPLADAMRAYADIDIALDTFPYNGGATTCDAIAHGVPVIALLGERMIARQSAALLHAAGHPEWIAATTQEYVALAVRLAAATDYNATRDALFHGVPGSALCDVRGFARALERAFRAMIDAGSRDGRDTPDAPLEVTD
jgi:predicted O-linked N-acetylglucosamine transferase (SPINDLY family)